MTPVNFLNGVLVRDAISECECPGLPCWLRYRGGAPRQIRRYIGQINCPCKTDYGRREDNNDRRAAIDVTPDLVFRFQLFFPFI